MSALDVRCPKCWAAPGEGCRSVRRAKPCRKPHRQRVTQVHILAPHPRLRRTRPTRQWATVRAQVLERAGGWCETGCRARAEHVHHVLPRSAGGRDDLANLLAVCWSCHRMIHDRPSWSYELGYLRRRSSRTVA